MLLLALQIVGQTGILLYKLPVKEVLLESLDFRKRFKLTKNNPLDSQYFYDKQLKIQAVGHVIDEENKSLSLKYNMKDNLSFILSEIESGYLNPELLISSMFSWSKLENAYKNLIKRVDSPITFGLEWKN